MKVIFLDIDGVLNSENYFISRENRNSDIDETRIPFLKTIVDATGAIIVLSSTWRLGWNKSYSQCTPHVLRLVGILKKYGLKIVDKTPCSSSGQRADEIKDWLSHHLDVESFVIIDDDNPDYNGNRYHEQWVKTSWYSGYGLSEENVRQAIEILRDN